jgi:hypothetical protein
MLAFSLPWVDATQQRPQANSHAASPEPAKSLSEVWRIHSSCACDGVGKASILAGVRPARQSHCLLQGLAGRKRWATRHATKTLADIAWKGEAPMSEGRWWITGANGSGFPPSMDMVWSSTM